MDLEIRDVKFAASLCRTRIPFRFGAVTLVEAPVVIARVRIRAGGDEFSGNSGDLCVPKWFDKNPTATSADNVRSLLASAERAGRAFSLQTGTAFEIWQRAHAQCVMGDLASGVALADGFGVALVERATLDAVCQAVGLSFRDALLQDVFGFRPDAVIPDAAGFASADIVVPEPLQRVLVRHTVGGLDPLRSAEVPAELQHDDGHPVALEEDIARFGLRAFKLKAGGDPAADARRLTDIARVVAEHALPEPIFTLDANEQYPDLGQLGKLLDALEADDDGRRLLEGLLYVEQPLPRAQTLDPASTDAVRAIASSVPLLIDEADDRPDAFRRAFDIGYRGVSVKNCKGVFRALSNRALCLAMGEGAFQTSEDLTNLPVAPLQQDLTTLAVLGLTHSERNGHHFFPGLDVVPGPEAEAALLAQPDLYERSASGRIVLRICDGALSLDCQHAQGYGLSSELAFDERLSLADFAKEHPE